jgi:hypothetical protein
MISSDRDFEYTYSAKQIGCHHAASPSAGQIGCLPHQNNSWTTSGLAGAMGGALVGSPRQARIFSIASFVFMAHRTLILEPQRGQARTSKSKDSAHEDLKYVSDQRRIVGETVAEGEGNRQHPLPHRDFGEYVVDEMSRRLSHAPPAARRTKGAAFARIRDDAVHTADIAVNPHKTLGQNTAIKKRAQLAFHKPGNYPAALPLPDKKGLGVLGYHMIKNALFRAAREILKSGFADAAAIACQ